LFLVALAGVSRQVHNWHGRHLVPWAVACVGVSVAVLLPRAMDRGRGAPTRWFAGLVAAVLCTGSLVATVGGYAAYRSPLQEARDSLFQLGPVGDLARKLDPARAPWGLVGYLQVGSERAASGSRADLFPVVLDRVLAGDEDLFSTEPAVLASAATLVYFEGDPAWIAALALAIRSLASGGADAGLRATPWGGDFGQSSTLVVLAEDPAAAQRLGRAVCALGGPGSVVPDDPRDAMSLLGDPNGSEPASPGLYPCGAPGPESLAPGGREDGPAAPDPG